MKPNEAILSSGLLSFMAGLLIIANGAAFNSIGFMIEPGSMSAMEFEIMEIAFRILSIYCFVLGGLSIAFSVVMFIEPKQYRTMSYGMVTVSTLSIAAGGGFVMGAICGILGGSIGIRYGSSKKRRR